MSNLKSFKIYKNKITGGHEHLHIYNVPCWHALIQALHPELRHLREVEDFVSSTIMQAHYLSSGQT